jgi:hypothetical protein
VSKGSKGYSLGIGEAKLGENAPQTHLKRSVGTESARFWSF